MPNYIRSIKNFGKGLKGTSIAFLGTVLMIGSPQTIPLGFVMTAKGVNDAFRSLQGDYIKDSMMSVETSKIMNKLQNHPENYIAQTMPTVKQFLQSKLTENKQEFLKLQEINLLLGLDTKDKNGKSLEYNTITHILNYKLLRELQEKGIISDLKKEPYGERSLKNARAMIGNTAEDKKYRNKRKNEIKERISEQKGFLNKFKTLREELNEGLDKKTRMFNISFKKTDRTFNEEEIANMLPFASEDGKIDRKKFNVKLDKEGNVKGINYSVRYIVQLLRQRVKERYDKAKTNIRENLSSLTNGISEIVENEANARDEKQVISGPEDKVI